MFARLLALVAFLIVAPVSAQPLPPPTASPPAIDPVETSAEALEADAAEVARLLDLPLPEALRRLEAQQASVPLLARLAEGYRDRLAGIVIQQRPDLRFLLVVTGAPAPDTLIASAPFGVPVLLRTGALATRAQTLDALAQHQADIRAAFSAPPGMGVDPRTGALLVLARPSELDANGGAEAMAARLQAMAGVPVEVEGWGDAANLSVEGGGRVIGFDAEEAHRFVCTSGFVVTDGRQFALSTAAHCPDTLSFVDRDRTEVPLTMIGAWGAQTQDVQLHTAAVPMPPLFHADDPARSRPVLGWLPRAETYAGDVVCHRGQRTGYGCALVQYPDFAPPGDLCAGPCPATWVAVAGPQCKGGDSGGPVFLGSVAIGLVKGESSEDGTCRLYYYMSVDYLPAGWTVLRGAPFPAPVPLPTPDASAGALPAGGH